MWEWLRVFFTNGDNLNEIFLIVIGIFIGSLFSVIPKMWGNLKKKIVLFKEKREAMKVEKAYMELIRQIENFETPIPRNFIHKHPRKKHPELENIYQMIDDGLLEEPYKREWREWREANPEKALEMEENMKKIREINILPKIHL